MNFSIKSNYLLIGRHGLSMLQDALAFALDYLGEGFFYHPDFYFIQLGDKKSIGVAEVAPVLEAACKEPVLAEKSLVIIERLDLLTEQAQNKLLLSLESSPNLCFLCIAHNEEALLSTVISRLFVVNYHPLSKEDFLIALKDSPYDEDTKRLLYVATGGVPGLVNELRSFVPTLVEVKTSLLGNARGVFKPLGLEKEKDRTAFYEKPEQIEPVLLVLMDALTKKASKLFLSDKQVAIRACNLVSDLTQYYHDYRAGRVHEKNRLYALILHIAEL